MAENAAEVLAAIARARTPPLTYILGSPDNICRLLDLCSERERPGSGTQLLVQVSQPKPTDSPAAKRVLLPCISQAIVSETVGDAIEGTC